MFFFRGGFLGPKRRALCERNQTQDASAQLILRRSTLTHLSEYLKSSKVRADCNMKHLLKLVLEDERAALAAVNEKAEADVVAPAFQEWSDSDLRNWHSAQRGRPALGRWEGELQDRLVDESLIEELGNSKGKTTIAVMDLLRLTDIHQIMVWLVCTLREASRPRKSFCARRQLLLKVLAKDTMEESFKSRALFIYG